MSEIRKRIEEHRPNRAHRVGKTAFYCLIAGLYEADNLIPADEVADEAEARIAAAVAAERERCAEIADKERSHFTRTAMLHPADSPSRDRCMARARSAYAIAAAIRKEQTDG